VPAMLAAVGSFGYNLMLVLHLITVVVAFAPAVAHALLGPQLRSLDPAARRQVAGFMKLNSRRVYAPALILMWVFGMGLAGLSDKLYRVAQPWLAISILVWIAMNGVLHAIVIPAERKVEAGDETMAQRAALGQGIINILLVVALVLMVWKPGAGS